MIVKDKIKRGKDKPYDMIMSCVKRDMRISGDAFRLYCVLFTWEENGTPTENGLAKQFGVKVLTIKRWIKQLKQYGYMTITGSKANGYIWHIHKYSLGVIDVEKQGIKFTPKKQNFKVSKMIPLNDTKMIPLNDTKMIPIIKDNARSEASACIANKLDEEFEEINFEEKLRNGTWKPNNPHWYY